MTDYKSEPINLACPLCGKKGTLLCESEFSERLGLPVNVGLSLCTECDFAYSHPRECSGYERYYQSNWNDQRGVREFTKTDKEHYEVQAANLAIVLERPESQRVLDIGCGLAGLLHTLRSIYPHHYYHGSDPAVLHEGEDNGIMFTVAPPTLPGKFDLISA
jgi:hypothetical protein